MFKQTLCHIFVLWFVLTLSHVPLLHVGSKTSSHSSWAFFPGVQNECTQRSLQEALHILGKDSQ